MESTLNQWPTRAAGFLFALTLLGSTLRCPASESEPPAAGAADATNRARVLVVHDPEATDAFRPRYPRVKEMLERGLTAVTGQPTAAQAWRSLVSTQEVVGIKVYSLPGPNSGTRPAVAEAVVETLIAAGLPPRQIVIWDQQAVNLRLSGFYEIAERYGVRAAGSAQAGYDEKNYYDTALLGNLVWGDHEFGKKGEGVGRRSYISKLVTEEITKIVNISPMLNHNVAGAAGNLFSLAAGSVDNFARFESSVDRMAVAVPEIYNLPSLADKVVLSIVDGLVCQYEGNERALLHYSSILNELRFSKDPVALDTLTLLDLERLRRIPTGSTNFLDLVENASLLELGISDTRRIDVQRLK